MFKKLDQYTRFLSRNKSENTVKNYEYQIIKFLEFLEGRGGIDNFTQEVFLDYIDIMKNKYSPSTIRVHATSINGFANFLVREGVLESQLFTTSSEMYEFLPVVNRRKHRAITREELRKMINSSNSLLEECLVRVSYDAATRVSELVNMKVSDILSNENGVFVTIKGKGRGGMSKVRVAQLTKETYDKIMKLNEDNNSDYVFTSELTKRPFSTRRIMQIIDDLSERAGVKGVTTHSFRGSKATDLVESGVPIEYVSEYLGHSSIETTKIYTDLTRKLHEKVGKFQMSL